jgi:hypothetical protein
MMRSAIKETYSEQYVTYTLEMDGKFYIVAHVPAGRGMIVTAIQIALNNALLTGILWQGYHASQIPRCLRGGIFIETQHFGKKFSLLSN